MLSTFLKEYAYSLQGSILIQFLKYYIVFFLGFMVDNILWIKLNLYKLYDRYFIDKNFYITNVKLVYYNLNNQLVTFPVFDYLKKKEIKLYNDQLFRTIINHYGITNIKLNEDTRFLIDYKVNNKHYRLFYGYYDLEKKRKENIEETRDLVLPFYDEEYMNIMKRNASLNNLLLYFRMNCKDIETFRINDKDYDVSIIEEFLGPYYDFGVLIKGAFKVKWLLDELQIFQFESIECKYLQLYFDEEEELDLVENSIKTHDINELFISKYTQNLLNQ